MTDRSICADCGRQLEHGSCPHAGCTGGRVKRCSCGAEIGDLPENRIHCTSHHRDEALPGVFDDPAWDIWDVCGGCGHVFVTEHELMAAAGASTVEEITACPYCGVKLDGEP